jgi:ADP-dependent NAD(P)H-hydrate dehydratase / NAD(P)H-hydrate epimerase
MGVIPDWCEPLLDVAQMRAIDRWAIDEQGIASLELMERAGAGVATEVERLAPDGPIAVVCGKGNNGGDGLVVARLLRERARDVTVICACDPTQLSGDARANLERLPGERPLQLNQGSAGQALEQAAAIVDALLGTGFEGSPQGEVAQAIEAVNRAAVNRAPAPVVSVDVPSGVDASTGGVVGGAVCAQVTVSFHSPKPGLWINPGKAHAGKVCTIDIGIPRGAPEQASSGLIEESALDLLPSRSARSTKFTSGHVVVAGGSAGLMGAPAMAAMACMRAGAGYVMACVPRSQAQIIDVQLLEVMTRSLSDERGSLTPQSVDPVLEALTRADALALGPGLGRQAGARSFARELARRAAVATLIDADGLNAHAGRLADLRARTAPTVLTPHAGELARLLEVDSGEVQRERLRHVRAASELSGAIVVLKGDDTLIACPDGRLAVSRGEAPALATAGSGDVLSGVIAALLAQRLDAFSAAAAGVFMHTQAAREATRRLGGADGVIASDVIAVLPAARGAARDTSSGAARDASSGAARDASSGAAKDAARGAER